MENGLNRDAVVKLVRTDSNQCVAFFYVASKATYEIKGIPDGQYNLLFCSGTDWDESKRSFTRNKRFSKFQDPSSWNTVRERNGNTISTRYSSHQITLHGVPTGNARTGYVSEALFDQYQ